MRPTVVLSGFFRTGNCGDEAILQAQYEHLYPEFDIIISVDHQDRGGPRNLNSAISGLPA